ncbi:hypothetical protein LTR22_027138 [Elasticomyces elasticus]|nr:hypothetical protein LTR22_027138 [Elasticomyces elasticus]
MYVLAPTSQSALYALLGIVLILLFKPIIDVLRSPVRHIPGPLLARFTRLWYFLHVKNGHFHAENLELHRKYGKVVRYAPGRYSIGDTDALKTIYTSGQGFNKSGWYAAFSPSRAAAIFTERDNKIHAGIRRKFQHTYSMSHMVSYEAFADSCTNIFRQRLTEHAEAYKPIDMAWWFNCYATDTLACISSSRRMGDLHVGEDAISERRKIRQAGKKVADGADEYAAKDMLDNFLDANDREPNHLTNGDIAAGMSGNVVAGSDTTAATLTALLYHMLKTPKKLTKLRREIADGSASGKLSSPVTFKQAQELPYLQAVIQETLRVHPSVGLPFERVVTAGGMHLCGNLFPEGSIVGVNAWVVHYDTEVYGPDAAEFKPERWFDSDQEKPARMRRNWLPFGLSSRTCIGKNISMLEMTKLVPELVRHFDFELVSSEEREVMSHWFVIPKALNATVKQRAHQH